MNGRNIVLASFIEALRRTTGFDFNVNRFDHRLRLQKLVYLAKVLGVPRINYEFNLYLRGPYSPNLADDYYRLSRDDFDENIVRFFLNNSAFKKLANLTHGKDGTWLEIATTLIELKKVAERMIEIGFAKIDKEELLVTLTYRKKPFVSRKYVKDVLNELKYQQII